MRRGPLCKAVNKAKYPSWARWLAMDADGTWWCYEAEPHQHAHGWYENEVGRSQAVQVNDDFDPAQWQSTLNNIKQ